MNEVKHLLRYYLDGGVFTAFDTETTGFSARDEKVIEIGAVKFDKNGLIDTYSVLINPNRKITPAITKITGISNDMVEECSLFASIAPSFLNFINDTKLVAHNANFDIGFINAELSRTEYKCLTPSQCNCVDTLKITRRIFTELDTYKLQDLAKTFKIKVTAAHRAYDDARVCMEVLLKCFEKVDPNFAEPSLF